MLLKIPQLTRKSTTLIKEKSQKKKCSFVFENTPDELVGYILFESIEFVLRKGDFVEVIEN